jgi:hypothetical protein
VAAAADPADAPATPEPPADSASES